MEEEKRTTTAARLKELMKEHNWKQADIITLTKPYFTEKTYISKTNMSMYVSGKVKPAQDKLYILGLALNVSEAWLMGFDVPRTRPERPEPSLVPTALPVDDLTPDEVEELKRYKQFIINKRDIKNGGA